MELVNGWNAIWNAIGIGGVVTVLGIIAAGILVWSLVSWLISRRRGGGGGLQGFPWMVVIIAGVFAMPGVLIPLFLGIIQVLIMLVVNVINLVLGNF